MAHFHRAAGFTLPHFHRTATRLKCGGCGRDMWSRYVAEICGRDMWPRYLAEICGRDMWPRYVAEICGRDMWPGDVARGCGHGMWPKYVAGVCGRGMFMASFGSRKQQTQWGEIWAELGSWQEMSGSK